MVMLGSAATLPRFRARQLTLDEMVTARVALVSFPPSGTVEVDGDFGLVAAYDIRRAVNAALGQGCRFISVDLSRVQRIDGAGIGALRACSEQVRAVGGRLTVTAVSGPVDRSPDFAARAPFDIPG